MLRNCVVSHMIEVPRLHRAVSWVVCLLEPFGLHSRFVSRTYAVSMSLQSTSPAGVLVEEPA